MQFDHEGGGSTVLAKPAIAKAKSVPSGDGTCAYAGAGFELHTELLESPEVGPEACER